MSWTRPVFSSMVSQIGYDPDTGEMLVTWVKSGKVSAYKVDEETAVEASLSASVGEFINGIKGSAPHRYR